MKPLLKVRRSGRWREYISNRNWSGTWRLKIKTITKIKFYSKNRYFHGPRMENAIANILFHFPNYQPINKLPKAYFYRNYKRIFFSHSFAHFRISRKYKSHFSTVGKLISLDFVTSFFKMDFSVNHIYPILSFCCIFYEMSLNTCKSS